jgi:Bifunctional DNA primase/polymerase, N-terminal
VVVLHASVEVIIQPALLVIAVSPERGGALARVPIVPIPQTGLVSTGDGGWHLYFTCKKTLIVNSQKDFLGPGIDLIAEDGYVIAPPSLNPTGGRYSWTKPEHIAPRTFPPKLLAGLQPQQGWTRSDYQEVLDLMARRNFPLTPTEIAHGRHTTVCKQRRNHIRQPHQLISSRRPHKKYRLNLKYHQCHHHHCHHPSSLTKKM